MRKVSYFSYTPVRTTKWYNWFFTLKYSNEPQFKNILIRMFGITYTHSLLKKTEHFKAILAGATTASEFTDCDNKGKCR